MLTFEKLCMGCMNDNGGEDTCPICGYVAGTKNPEGTLPIKTRIHGRYFVGKVLEINGEGITYIGWDNDENSIINIREFFPVPLAKRNDDLSVAMNEGDEYAYNTALLDFIELGKSLQGISISAVPETYDVIECNSTAYIITKSITGITLREFLLKNGGTLSFEQARPLFMPLISAIISLHKSGIIHGGISPETVIVGREGKLYLTGFSIPELRKSGSHINSQIFPGYAAIEQYNHDDSITPATDVYGFASTLFRVLMGSTLPEASERITDDKMSIPAKIAEALPQAVLVALANALQILFENRTKTMEDFKLDIAPAVDSTASFVAGETVTTKEKPVSSKVTSSGKTPSAKKYAVISASVTAGIFLIIAILLWLIVAKPFSKKPEPDPQINVSNSQPDESDESSSSTLSNSGEKLLTVPDFTNLNLTFEEICNQYPDFKYEIVGKKYASKSAGIVVAQDIKAGSEVKRDTTIYLTISLGPETITVPDIKGKTEQEAIIELYKKGFLYHNITFYEIEDSSVDYHCVVKTDPAFGSTVSPDASIKIYYSSVKSETQSSQDGQTYEP